MKIDIKENEVMLQRITDSLCKVDQEAKNAVRTALTNVGVDLENVTIEGAAVRNNFDLHYVLLLINPDQTFVKMRLAAIFLEAESVEESSETPAKFFKDPENGDAYCIMHMPYENQTIKISYRLLFK